MTQSDGSSFLKRLTIFCENGRDSPFFLLSIPIGFSRTNKKKAFLLSPEHHPPEHDVEHFSSWISLTKPNSDSGHWWAWRTAYQPVALGSRNAIDRDPGRGGVGSKSKQAKHAGSDIWVLAAYFSSLKSRFVDMKIH